MSCLCSCQIQWSRPTLCQPSCPSPPPSWTSRSMHTRVALFRSMVQISLESTIILSSRLSWLAGLRKCESPHQTASSWLCGASERETPPRPPTIALPSFRSLTAAVRVSGRLFYRVGLTSVVCTKMKSVLVQMGVPTGRGHRRGECVLTVILFGLNVCIFLFTVTFAPTNCRCWWWRGGRSRLCGERGGAFEWWKSGFYWVEIWRRSLLGENEVLYYCFVVFLSNACSFWSL